MPSPENRSAAAVDFNSVRVDDRDGAAVLFVHVSPGAKRDRVTGVHGDALKLSIAAPPEGGRANKALVDFIAHLAGVKRSCVAVVGGLTARRKQIRIDGVTAAGLRGTLASADKSE